MKIATQESMPQHQEWQESACEEGIHTQPNRSKSQRADASGSLTHHL